MIDRILQASGYHSFKGRDFPCRSSSGRRSSVSIPARLDRPAHRPEPALRRSRAGQGRFRRGRVRNCSQYCGTPVGRDPRVAVCVDPNTMEGFLVGLEEEGSGRNAGGPCGPCGWRASCGGFRLSFLGSRSGRGSGCASAGKGRVSSSWSSRSGSSRREAGIRGRHGKDGAGHPCHPGESGYTVFPAGRDEPGRAVFQRLLRAAGFCRRGAERVSPRGGRECGIRHPRNRRAPVPSRRRRRKARTAVLVRGKVHTATRALLRDLGVEIVEW